MTHLAPRSVFSRLSIAALCLAICSVAKAQPDPYSPIPAGFDFPADQATLERFRETEDVSEMRRHTWWVWAGVNQPTQGGGPVWETWYPTSFVFRLENQNEVPGAPRTRPRFEIPRQFGTDSSQPAPEVPGQAMLSFVLFNQEASDHIRDNKLFLQSELNQTNNDFPAETPLSDRKILEFPPKAVVLKLVWDIVKQNGMTEQPIWDFEPTQPFDQENPPNTWKRKILIDPSRESIPPGETQNGNHVVSISRFYHFKIDTPELVASAPGAELGDFAVLAGMHVTTKEIDDWVWATFWWHDRPNAGPCAAGRHNAVQGVWRNYLMDIAYDTDTLREFDGTANACMNPWLEARFKRGMGSNCMTCHQRSTWPQVSFLPVTRGGMNPEDPFFANRTKLDFLWSIGDRALP